MSTIADLVLDIQHASGPARALDVTIGKLMGYRRTVTKKDEKEKIAWVNKHTGHEGSLPRFTGNIDAARTCAEFFVPGCKGGYSWNTNYATAKINDGPIISGATPALAICAAALSSSQIDIVRQEASSAEQTG